MRRALLRLAGRASNAAASSADGSAGIWPPDAKALKEEHVNRVREIVFGPQGNLPGDRNYRKKLEGRTLMQWYFPSKYSLQDFRVDEYFEMQAERFAPREIHTCIPQLTEMLEEVSKHREVLRSFFNRLDEPTFMDSPSLQDLYGLFRLVDPDPVLAFTPSPMIFREHSPLFGQQPPFRAFAAHDTKGEDSGDLEALLARIMEQLGESDRASALEAQFMQLQSLDEIREVLLAEAARLNVVVRFEDVKVAVENDEAEAEAEAKAKEEAEAKERAKAEAEAEAEAKAKAEAKAEAETKIEDEKSWLGTWIYDFRGKTGKLEVSKTDDGVLQLQAELAKTPVTGKLQPEGKGDLYAQLFDRDGKAMGSVHMQRQEPGCAVLDFQRLNKTTEIKLEKQQEEPPPAEGDAGPPGSTWEVPPTRQGEAPLATGTGEAHLAGKDESLTITTGTSNEEKASPGQPPEPEEKLLEGEDEEGALPQAVPNLPEKRHLQLHAYASRSNMGGRHRLAQQRSNEKTENLKSVETVALQRYLKRRHRFIDPMYRRRRLKWIERQMAELNGKIEVKFNSYYIPHPDDVEEWPTNKGSTTVVWPSPYH